MIEMLFFITPLLLAGVVVGQPSWLSECVGYGCRATENYNHQSCQADPNYISFMVCVALGEGTHITFSGSGTIEVPDRFREVERLIIDGSGHDVRFSGRPIFLGSFNIVYRINFIGGADDGITLNTIEHHDTWIHRCTFGTYDDGQVDITNGYGAVTVSNSRFEVHDKGMLIGSSINAEVTDIGMTITLSENYWNTINQRSPRVRFATVHILNSVFDEWGIYSIASCMRAKVLIQNSYFRCALGNLDAAHRIQQANDPELGYIRAENEGNYYEAGISGETFEPAQVPDVPYSYTRMTAGSEMRDAVIANSGYQS